MGVPRCYASAEQTKNCEGQFCQDHNFSPPLHRREKSTCAARCNDWTNDPILSCGIVLPSVRYLNALLNMKCVRQPLGYSSTA